MNSHAWLQTVVAFVLGETISVPGQSAVIQISMFVAPGQTLKRFMG